MAMQKLGDLMYTYYKNAVADIQNVVGKITHVGGTAQTGRDLSLDLAKLDIALSALRDAITASGMDATTLQDVKDAIDLLEIVSSEITKWGGTIVTGRDVSLDLKALTDDSIKGILKSLGDIGVGESIATILSNLSKAEDSVHSSGDKGIILLGVRKDDVAEMSSADGDYNVLVVNEDGILRTQAQQHLHLDEMGATTGWTVLGNDTVNFSTTTNHVLGTLALEFDKVHGAADTVFAGIQKTLSGLPSFRAYEKGNGFFLWSMYLSSVTDVDYVFLRLGTDSSNYNEWRISGDSLSTGWSPLRMSVLSPDAVVGNGWNSASVTYGAVGVAFDNKTDTLADIAVDHLALNTGLQTSADITAEVTSEASSPNVKVTKWGNDNVDANAGAVGDGTLRTTLGSDDPAVVSLAVLRTLTSSVATTPTQITKTVAATGTPEALAPNGTYFRMAKLSGKKAARTDNAGIVYLGIGGTDNTQPFPINPGEEIEIKVPPGEKFDLNDWYCDVLNAGDGLTIIYA